MARFQFNLPPTLGFAPCASARAGSAHAGSAHAEAALRTLHAFGPGDAPGASAGPAGPGWFDSSWDLVRGLDVLEGLPGDAALHEWLEVSQREPRARSVCSVFAQCHEQPGPRLLPTAPHGAFGDALEFGDLDLAVTAEVAHLDQFSQFGIEALELA